jgi:hypothetical protein
MDFPWKDRLTDDNSHIKVSIKAWRAAFPVARVVNVSKRDDIVDADFVHIRGDARVRLHAVDMSKCPNVTDAAFVHLRGIRGFFMSSCNQGNDHRRSILTFAWDSHTRHAILFPANDHKCSFLASTWNSSTSRY